MVEESLYRLLAKPAPAFVDWILRHEETFIDLNCTYANAIDRFGFGSFITKLE